MKVRDLIKQINGLSLDDDICLVEEDNIITDKPLFCSARKWNAHILEVERKRKLLECAEKMNNNYIKIAVLSSCDINKSVGKILDAELEAVRLKAELARLKIVGNLSASQIAATRASQGILEKAAMSGHAETLKDINDKLFGVIGDLKIECFCTGCYTKRWFVNNKCSVCGRAKT